MAGFRVNRTGEDIKRELTDIIRSVKDPRVSTILTIIKTELSKDLSHCKVWVSSLEGLQKAQEACKGISGELIQVSETHKVACPYALELERSQTTGTGKEEKQ